MEFPNISFDTVNRTLLTFSKVGLVNIVESYRGPDDLIPILNNIITFTVSAAEKLWTSPVMITIA